MSLYEYEGSSSIIYFSEVVCCISFLFSRIKAKYIGEKEAKIRWRLCSDQESSIHNHLIKYNSYEHKKPFRSKNDFKEIIKFHFTYGKSNPWSEEHFGPPFFHVNPPNMAYPTLYTFRHWQISVAIQKTARGSWGFSLSKTWQLLHSFKLGNSISST